MSMPPYLFRLFLKEKLGFWIHHLVLHTIDYESDKAYLSILNSHSKINIMMNIKHAAKVHQ